MTDDEALDEIRHLKGLFTLVTKEQCVYWRDRFLNYEKSAVSQAIERYADLYDGKDVDRQAFLSLIESCAGHRDPKYVFDQERLAAINRKLAAESELAMVNATHAKINQSLSGLSDSDLEELKGAVMLAKPDLAKFLQKSDPKKSPMLRSLMAQHLRGALSPSVAR